MTDQHPGTVPQGSPPAGLGEPLPHREPHPLRGAVAGVLLAVLAGAAVWAALAGAGPARLDAAALGGSVQFRTSGLTAEAVALTEIGNTFSMGVVASLVGLWCWVRGRRADAVFVVGAMAGAVLLFRGIKIWLDRPRPPAAVQVVTETNESLPSGHATMSMVVIGALVVLAWAGRGPLARLLMVAGAVLWVGAVGATRVYLGVHWFSDVLAGWLVGAAWLALCAAAWSLWRRRAAAPRPSEQALGHGPRPPGGAG
ncbi:MAG: phosphatase PAP2 family protein [Pseudonocardiales bacterium]|nr:phosphatase PAP2 family protein [Pseudonocardiales bacterium]